jgi:hypothetical protein
MLHLLIPTGRADLRIKGRSALKNLMNLSREKRETPPPGVNDAHIIRLMVLLSINALFARVWV